MEEIKAAVFKNRETESWGMPKFVALLSLLASWHSSNTVGNRVHDYQQPVLLLNSKPFNWLVDGNIEPKQVDEYELDYRVM